MFIIDSSQISSLSLVVFNIQYFFHVIDRHMFSGPQDVYKRQEQGAIHSLFSDEHDPLNCWTCAISDYKLCCRSDHGFMLPANVCPAMDSGIHENYIHRLFEELDLLRKFSSDTHMAACDALAVSLASIYFELFLADPKTERHKDSSFARDILIYICLLYTSRCV